jgi:uncharacterized membrane protein YfcA
MLIKRSGASMHEVVLGIGIGLIAGVLSGLLGVGGGVLLVPAMVFLLQFSQHRAHGTSLAVILFVALAGLYAYITTGQMDWLIVLELSTGAVVGAVLGAQLANRLPAATLRRYFGGFLILVAARMLYDVVGVVLLDRSDELAGHGIVAGGVWSVVLVLGIGLATGILSGLLGVGGGIIMVPAMVFLLGFTQTLAQGISLAVIIPTAISGAFVHYRQGNIRPRDVLWLAVGGVAGAFAGSFLAVRLDVLILRSLFGLLLLVLGLMMVWRRRRTPASR